MNISDFYKNISNSIKFYRKKFDMTQQQLADKSGLSIDYIGKIEAGINKPGIVGLYKIVSAFEISFKDFFSKFEE